MLLSPSPSGSFEGVELNLPSLRSDISLTDATPAAVAVAAAANLSKAGYPFLTFS